MNIQKPSRELSVGEILSQTFNLYFSRFAQFLLPFLFAGIVSGVFTVIVRWWYLDPLMEEFQNAITPTMPPDEALALVLDFLGKLIVIAILLGAVTWFINTIVSSTVVKFTSNVIEKGSASLGESLNMALSRLGSLLGAGLITGILTIIGFFLFVVPGIILAIMFSLVVPAIMIEQKGVFESLGRSKKLVSNRWGKTFVLLLLVGIITLFVIFVTSALTAPLGAASMFASSLVGAFVAPILPIVTTLLYYSMVAREIPPPPPPPEIMTS